MTLTAGDSGRTRLGTPTGVAPVIIGHRGARVVAMENSLASFAAAVASKVDAVECDVRVSADGVVVCSHDGSLARLGGVSGPLSRLPFAELRASVLADGSVVPTLAEVLDLLEGKAGIVIELKNELTGSNADPTHEVAEAVVRLLNKRRRAGHADEVRAVSSFNAGTLAAFAEAAPELRGVTALLGEPHQSARRLLAAADEQKLGQLHAHWGSLLRAPGVVAKAARAGIGITCWTVNSRLIAKLLLLLGVTSIISDYPKRMVHLFRHLR